MTCYAWADCAQLPAVTPGAPPVRERRGQLLTTAIDSGIPRCRWHRVRVDADVPFGTALEVAVATIGVSDDAAARRRHADPWWHAVPRRARRIRATGRRPQARDFLVDQPPGRYAARPAATDGRRPRPRRACAACASTSRASTSLERLPAVYREDPEAEDFTERFLSLFDATDRRSRPRHRARAGAARRRRRARCRAAVARRASSTSCSTPRGRSAQRRALLAAAPELYRQRGTVAGLTQTIELVMGATPAIEELPLERLWGALEPRRTVVSGTAPVRPRARALHARSLHARQRARCAASATALGSVHAARLPLPRARCRPGRRWLRAAAAIDCSDSSTSQKPAHTAATVRVGGTGFIVGVWANVGVDSVLAPLRAAGAGRARQRAAVAHERALAGSATGARPASRVGTTARVGTSTVIAMSEPISRGDTHELNVCATVPSFDRLNYFYGQLLGARRLPRRAGATSARS